VLAQHCSAAHAEIVAFAAAQARMQRARLNEDGRRYVLATSAQPCAMCYGASFWAGIDEILIGARSSDVAELSEFDEGPLPSDWIGEFAKRGIAVCRDIRREEVRAVFRRYAELGGARY
jgi:tRNA(Arg) A34 adenosine deaminase TadA